MPVDHALKLFLGHSKMCTIIDQTSIASKDVQLVNDLIWFWKNQILETTYGGWRVQAHINPHKKSHILLMHLSSISFK